MKPLLSTFILLLLINFSHAQKSWSLHDCIDYALRNNLELLNYQYQIKSSQENLKQSFREFLPKINGYADLSVQYGRSIDPSNNDYVNTDFFSNNYRVEAEVDLFQGLKRFRTIKSSKLLFEASKHDEMHQRYMLAFDVMSAYLDVLYFDELLEISQEQLSISQANCDLINKNIELGIKAGSDLFEAKSTLLSDSLLFTQSVNSLQEAQLNLQQKMNLPTEQFIMLDSASVDQFMLLDYDLLSLTLDTIYQKALGFIPDIKSSELKVYAAGKQVDIARSELYPTVTMFGGYGTGYFETFLDSEGNTISFRDQISDNAKQLIGVSLNVPIFQSGSNYSKIELSKIEALKEENVLRQKKQSLRKVIQNLILEQKALHNESKLSANNIQAQELAFTTAQKKYENGLINILEFHQAKTAYSKSLTDNLLIKFNYIITKSTLAFYYGLPVFNDLIKN